MPRRKKLEIEKEARVSRETARLWEVYQEIGPKRKKIIDGLINRASYMRITLEDYEQDLDKNGYVEMFTQSDKTDPYERERPVARLYNTMNKNYQSIIKLLTDCIIEADFAPRDANRDSREEFERFTGERDD